MKLILTEEQSKRLINNIIKEQETLKKLSGIANFFKSDNNIDDFESPVEGSPEFMGNISPNTDMIHPLGKKYKISSKFGRRNTGIRGSSRNHKGIDISVPSGSPVYSPKDGIIESARDTSPNGCGGFIKINHGDIITKFCHLRKWVVNSGDNVKKGQLIGYSGGGENDPYRGTSSGSHLHYEILNTSGVALNPTEVQNNLV